MPETGTEGLEIAKKPVKEEDKTRSFEDKRQKIIMQVEKLSRTCSKGKTQIQALQR
jgi:hypothetical protein